MTTSKRQVPDFSAMALASQQKRASNRESSREYLERSRVAFVVKSEGSHLIVTGSKGLIDFWPGTGKWISRSGIKGRGVLVLADAITNGNL